MTHLQQPPSTITKSILMRDVVHLAVMVSLFFFLSHSSPPTRHFHLGNAQTPSIVHEHAFHLPAFTQQTHFPSSPTSSSHSVNMLLFLSRIVCASSLHLLAFAAHKSHIRTSFFDTRLSSDTLKPRRKNLVDTQTLPPAGRSIEVIISDTPSFFKTLSSQSYHHIR